MSDKMKGEILLGLEIGRDNFTTLLSQAGNRPIPIQETRLQKRKKLSEEQTAAVAEQRDGATPLPVDDRPGDTVESDLDAIQECEDENVQAVVAKDGVELPLPEASKDDIVLLQELTKSDEILASNRYWADKSEKGYFWKNGLVYHHKLECWDGPRQKIVVPQSFRSKILTLAHEHCGHLGVNKMRKLIGTWTGLQSDIVRHCAACEVCQKNSKGKPKAAPIQTVPTIIEPWERMAFDLVGPFPRSKEGYKYILTSICLASKYPDAIPLKDISAGSVAEGMTEMWSRTGIPREILTDQGSQFMSQLSKQLCERLHINRVRSLHYHPQSNGTVERLHGTLIPMIKKACEEKLTWPLTTEVCLFALRGMPNRDTGFTPFEIVYGRNLYNPLSLLYDSWVDPVNEPVNLVAWMEMFEKRVRVVSESLKRVGKCKRVAKD